MAQVQLNVVTRLQDNGDGGYTLYAYNTTEELLKDHPMSRKWVHDDRGATQVTVELTEEQKREILTEDDPYENGYIGSDTIYLNIEGDKVTLSKPLHFHAGQ